MAQSIVLTSGSVLNGNPITFAVTPSIVVDPNEEENTISMHRIVLEVECGMTGGNYEVIQFTSPVIIDGQAQVVDISSALRTFRDTYEYTPEATTYPIVKFNVKAYDEYLLSGDLRTTGVRFYPTDPNSLPPERRDEAYLRTIFGAFSDAERMDAGETKNLQFLTRKPTTLPQIVAVGEPFAYTPPYTTEQKLEQSSALTAPQSKAVTVPKEGVQQLGYQPIYALPESEAPRRQVFFFINSFGVLESISVPRNFRKSLTTQTTPYTLSRPQTFGIASRGALRKQNNQEAWHFQTDPLDEAWLIWFHHEFLMSENVWLYLPSSEEQGGGSYLRVLITPEDEATLIDANADTPLVVNFTAKFDFNGSPI